MKNAQPESLFAPMAGPADVLAAWLQSPAQRLRFLLGAVSSFLLAIGFAAVGAAFLNDADTLWHIAVGRDIWETKSFPQVDAYSHTFAGEPWIAKEWLSQILLFALHAAGGWDAVVMATVVVLLIVFWQIYLGLTEHIKPLIAAAVAIAALGLCSPVYLARPHIFALPLVVLFVYRLWAAGQEGRAPSFWLLAVLCLWANMHASFTFGILAACLAFLRFLYEHRRLQSAATYRWAAFIALCPLVSVLHPYGLEAVWSTASVAQSEALPYIREWRAFSAQRDAIPELTIVALIAAAIASGVRVNIVAALFVCFLLHLYFTHMRFIYLFFLLSPLALAKDLAAQFPALSFARWSSGGEISRFERALAGRAGPLAAGLAAGTVLLLAGAAAIASWAPTRTYPIAAIDAARAAGVAGNVLNQYNFGGALIFEGVPTFVDGRADRLFQDGFIPDIAKTWRGDADVLQAQIEKYAIGWTLLPPDDMRVRMLDEMNGWKRIYDDDIAVVHIRESAAE